MAESSLLRDQKAGSFCWFARSSGEIDVGRDAGFSRAVQQRE